MGRLAKQVPVGYKWCSYHQMAELKETFSGNEHSCRQGRYFYHIRAKYSLTEEKYNQLLDEVWGMCHCCHKKPPSYVDHDHTTGKVRGLLCPTCNTAVGYRENNENLFEKVDEYIMLNNAAIARQSD